MVRTMGLFEVQFCPRQNLLSLICSGKIRTTLICGVYFFDSMVYLRSLSEFYGFERVNFGLVQSLWIIKFCQNPNFKLFVRRIGFHSIRLTFFRSNFSTDDDQTITCYRPSFFWLHDQPFTVWALVTRSGLPAFMASWTDSELPRFMDGWTDCELSNRQRSHSRRHVKVGALPTLSPVCLRRRRRATLFGRPIGLLKQFQQRLVIDREAAARG
jgi:hypothetical protein